MVLDKPKLDRVAELVAELERMGMKVYVELGNRVEDKTPSPASANSESDHSKQRDGTRRYWDEVEKIKNDEKCTIWEARQRYSERRPKDAVNVAENPDAFRQKMSVLKKAYWAKVNDLAKEKGISKIEARRILSQRGQESLAEVPADDSAEELQAVPLS